MSLSLSRPRAGEWLALLGSVGLTVTLFAAHWYAAPARFRASLLALGEPVSASGWQTFGWLGPLCLLVGLLGIAAFLLAAGCASPAMPVISVTLLMPLALVLVLALAVRELVARPALQLPAGAGGPLQTLGGAYLGLGCALLIALGAWLCLRRDAVAPGDAPVLIETFRIGPPSPGAEA